MPNDLITRLNSEDRTYVVHSESDWESRATPGRNTPFLPSHSITTVLERFFDMGLINAEDPLPGHVWATVRLLLASKERSLAAADAQALLAPPPSLGERSSSIFRKTTRLLSQFGLLDNSDGLLRIANDELAAVHRDDVQTFAGLLRRVFFADEQNTELTAPTGEVSQTGALDLNRALAWFLSLDPYTGYDLEAELPPRASKALRPEAGSKALVREERLSPFRAWSQFLGLASSRVVIAGGRGR